VSTGRPLIVLLHEELNANPDGASDVIAKSIVDKLAKDALLELAIKEVTQIVERHRRNRTRQTEMAATTSTSTASTQPDASHVIAEEYARIEALRKELAPQIQRAQQAVVMHWTKELLESRFALGDGRRPTWGEATAEEHNSRIQLLLRNTYGNLMTIARHTNALAAISAASTQCLNEAVADDD